MIKLWESLIHYWRECAAKLSSQLILNASIHHLLATLHHDSTPQPMSHALAAGQGPLLKAIFTQDQLLGPGRAQHLTGLQLLDLSVM